MSNAPQSPIVSDTNNPSAPLRHYHCRGCTEVFEDEGLHIHSDTTGADWCSPECYRTEDCVCHCSHGSHEGGIYEDGPCNECGCGGYEGSGVGNGECLDPDLLERLEASGRLL